MIRTLARAAAPSLPWPIALLCLVTLTSLLAAGKEALDAQNKQIRYDELRRVEDRNADCVKALIDTDNKDRQALEKATRFIARGGMLPGAEK